MADTVSASNPQEILDLLFDANEGVLTESNQHSAAVNTSSKVEMPILDWVSVDNQIIPLFYKYRGFQTLMHI